MYKVIKTSIPTFIGSNIFFQDEKSQICMYDRKSQRKLWVLQIGHNWSEQVFVSPLNDEYVLVGGSLGQLVIVDNTGQVVEKLGAEKRISTSFTKIGENTFVYGNKSELKAQVIYV